MHQSIPTASSIPRANPLEFTYGKFPGAVAIKLSNAHRWGQKSIEGKCLAPAIYKIYIYPVKNYSKCCGISSYFIIIVLFKK